VAELTIKLTLTFLTLTLTKFNRVELVFLFYILLCCYTVYALEQVPNPAPGGPLSCRVQLRPQLNTPEPANQDLIRHTKNF